MFRGRVKANIDSMGLVLSGAYLKIDKRVTAFDNLDYENKILQH